MVPSDPVSACRRLRLRYRARALAVATILSRRRVHCFRGRTQFFGHDVHSTLSRFIPFFLHLTSPLTTSACTFQVQGPVRHSCDTLCQPKFRRFIERGEGGKEKGKGRKKKEEAGEERERKKDAMIRRRDACALSVGK